MILTILQLLSWIPTALRLRSELALENLALRQQLAVIHRQHRRPRIRKSDRVFWLLLSRFWGNWKETLVIVRPETVLRWHRKRFASYWTRLSRRSRAGRPTKDRGVRELIRRMAMANPLWGALPGARGAFEAGNRHLRENRFSLDAATKETALPNLESIPG